MKPWIKKTLWGVAITTVLFVGIMGFAHTPWGRPLLGLLHGVPGCPLGFDQPVDPAKAEARRQEVFKNQLAGSEVARSSRALGFDLGSTNKAKVQEWALATGSVCESKREGAALSCSSVPEAAAGGLAIDDALLVFDLEGRLVAVDVFRTASAADAVAKALSLRKELDAAIGTATSTLGEFDAEFIAGGAMRRASAEYKYQQYNAQLSVMNFGNGRIRLREKYQWVPTVQTASR